MALEAATIAAISAAGTVAGAGIGIYGTVQASAASRRAEALRRKQMRIDASNKRRSAIRQQILANSIANTRSVSQGIGEGSSVLFGALGQAAGEAGRNISGTNMAERIGSGIFDANADLATGQAIASAGNQLGNLGVTGLTNAQSLSSNLTTLFGTQTPTAASWIDASGPSIMRPLVPQTTNPLMIPTGTFSPWYSNTGGD